jgi:hypothetical protein
MPPRKQHPKPKRTQKQSGPGAPTICTPELTRQFAELMAAGNYLETVAGYLHVSQQDAYNWLKWGAEGKDATGPDPAAYRNFFEAVTHAERQAEVRAAALLQRAGQDRVVDLPTDPSKQFVQGDWRAIAEFMARRYPRRWSKAERVQQELTGKDGKALQVETNGDAIATLASAIAGLAARRGQGGGTGDADE